jgi:thiamine biosynthesis lipoprotein
MSRGAHADLPAAAPGRRFVRRARPLLGTLVEVGAGVGSSGPGAAAVEAAVDAAFATVSDVQRCLSRFEAGSDVTRFHALRAGQSMPVAQHTVAVLAAARSLHAASDAVFDITLCSAPDGWRCEEGRWHKLNDAVRIDLGGIGKGYAVDCAVNALLAHGCSAGWVNAGGDVRAFGSVDLPLHLRNEGGEGSEGHEGDHGLRPFATLGDGAFATSRFGAGSRSQALWRPRAAAPVLRACAHASVAAPLCLWADALTKVVAITGDTSHPLLARHGARAWLH